MTGIYPEGATTARTAAALLFGAQGPTYAPRGQAMTSTATETAAQALTRAEAAYAHLASFQRGDAVDVAGPGFFLPGTVTVAQKDGRGPIEGAYLIVSGCGTSSTITVAALLSGDRAVTLQTEAARGNVQWFDETTWAMRNGGDCGTPGCQVWH